MKKGGLFVTGTDTGVGKTLVTAVLGAILQEAGIGFGVFKPVQTDVRGGRCPDLEVYKKFFKLPDPEREVVPVRFRAPQAPSIAAFLENKGVRIEKIIQSFYILREKHENLLIEGLGGAVVPLSQKVWLPDLMKKCGLPVLVVARPTLGTINHTCLTVSFLKRTGIRVAGIVFNRTGNPGDPVFKKVKEAIMRFTGVDVLGHLKNFNMNRVGPPRIIWSAQKTLKVPEILNHFIR